MRMFVASFRLAVAVAFLAAASGCGSNMHPVSGVVKLADGTPATVLDGEEITFTATDKPVMCRGEIGPDGRFNAYTNRLGDGMAPGTYKVAVSWPDDPVLRKKKGRKKAPAPFDMSVTDAEKSEVTVTINPGSNELEITLPPPKKQ